MTKEVVHGAVLRYGAAPPMFVTAFAGIIDIETGVISYVNAGHDSPLVIAGERGVRRLTTAGGPPFGALDPFPYPIDRDQVEPGELLLLYTDGITEAQSGEHALYSLDRLERLLTTLGPLDAERLVTAVLEDLHRFADGADQADDITLLVLRRAPEMLRRPMAAD